MSSQAIRALMVAAAIGSLVSLSGPANADSSAAVDPAFPHPQPPYPDGAQLSGEQGTVVINLFVRANGRPSKAKILQSSGFNDLDTAALEGVLNWRFLPAVRGGDTVSDWTSVKIVYQLPTAAPAMTPAKATK